ncbi:DUF3086 domain-containing protein [Almyronema epifaneia]|uniref:DUF3086 domain-containing protein n=1 Tax=Almyronema epifaneia S1 TaxID=2991925 RepID=A0ABW6IJE8_9CYAN
MAAENFSNSDTTAPAATGGSSGSAIPNLEQQVASLRTQEADLKRSIEELKTTYSRLIKDQAQTLQSDLSRLIRQNLSELEQQRQTLKTEVEQLERRQERIRAEMRTSFAGVSQDLAIRVQGFKEYLVGSLQDLATAAEQLELTPAEVFSPAPSRPAPEPVSERAADESRLEIGFANQRFQEQTERVRSLIDQYRLRPDYYGPVWQLRRTFEPVHADRIANWFFTQGGRGAIKSMGSRLQNVLIASAGISILHALYGSRLRSLVLANTPERLGEWRRGLQDCLGISRTDFGTNRGVMLFEAAEPLVQRADRLVENGLLPLIIVDESEDKISLSLLQFPLWLAFAPDPANPIPEYDF